MPWPQDTALLREERKALLGNAQMCLERWRKVKICEIIYISLERNEVV